ncbi:MAG: hypothetical protein AB1634_05915 [Thermodesulfobacteriota bacterium]
MPKRLFVLTVLCLLILRSAAALAAEERAQVPIGSSPSTGPANAPVTIVEFLDFQ